MSQPLQYLASYDIKNPRRLRRAFKVLLDYALERQKSVFECHLSQQHLENLLQRIQQEIDPEQDRFALVRLDPRSSKRQLGKAAQQGHQGIYYLG